MERIVQGMDIKEVLRILRGKDGYFITNTARDLSQSDYKNRILLHTDLLAAPSREKANFFSLEITGGASVHVDILRKQVDPFLKLELLREKMPNTMFQTLCRGVNLFGYRPYPQNVIRKTVKEFAKYVDVWRVFDFMNHIPNMQAVFEEVQAAGRILEPCICFSTGPEHTDEYYVSKVQDILDVTGEDIILCIKNHGGLGTPKRIGDLVNSIRQKYPDLMIHYHGHNTDGNDVGRITSAVLNGANIVDAADHAFTGYYGPPPILTVIDTLKDYGHETDVDYNAVIETSEELRHERDYYVYFESQFKGFSPTVQQHKLPGGATGSSFEQAVKGNFLDKMPEILHNELPQVQKELGNYWSVTPGSQILWTTAVSNVLCGERYGEPSGDLKNLLLGKYGPFPFYEPPEWIYEKVFGDNWKEILEKEGGIEDIEDMDVEKERATLAKRIGKEPTEQQLVTYLQHPNDAVDFFKFEEEFGQTYVLPPSVFLRHGGYDVGETIQFTDHYGKEHIIETGPKQLDKEVGEWEIYLNVDHHQRVYSFEEEAVEGAAAKAPTLSKEEIEELASAGDFRAPFNANVCDIQVEEGQEVAAGDTLAVVEAMKMQTPVTTGVAGTVEKIFAELGQAMKPGDKLIKLKVSE